MSTEKLWVIVIFCGLSATIYVYGCQDNTTTEKPGGYVAGFVTDSVTTAPIYEAWVSLDTIYDSPQVLTDSTGYYILDTGFPVTRKSLYCGKSGYLTQAKEFSVSSRDTALVDFRLVSE